MVTFRKRLQFCTDMLLINVSRGALSLPCNVTLQESDNAPRLTSLLKLKLGMELHVNKCVVH